MACPLGIRINRVPLHMNLTDVIFRPIKRLKLIGGLFRRGPQIFIQCCQRRIMERYAVLMCRYYNILYGLL